MGLIKTRKAYLIAAIISFILSIYGFAGILSEGRRGRHASPIYFGVLLLICGGYFLYCYFRSDNSRELKAD
jgi:hypothetical protein